MVPTKKPQSWGKKKKFKKHGTPTTNVAPPLDIRDKLPLSMYKMLI
jgi:hypothetical protein